LQFSDVTVNLQIGDLAKTISSSDLQKIIELYVAFFNRVPDADGLAYWISKRSEGQSINQIAESFYNAGIDYSSVTGYTKTMSNQAFVNIVYKNVLGRSDGGDADGVAYWSDQLATGKATRGSLVSTMLDSAHGLRGCDLGRSVRLTR